MVKETERLTRLVNELLDLARIEAGRMDWRMEQLDLRELIRDAVASVGQLFEERRITLTQDFPDRPMIAQGDHDRLMRVLINLLYRCEVIDNGPGIPKEQLELVFERFQQVSDPDSGKPRGSGLGLTICQRIIEHHGGRIWASSVIGEGTTMTFELPRAEVSPSGHTA
jgi:signal transduction histidine kinase